jgi:hypothetical protein
MRITEAQLRRIIREEARRVLEGADKVVKVYVVSQGDVHEEMTDGTRKILGPSLGPVDEWTGPDPKPASHADLYGAENIKSVPGGGTGSGYSRRRP